MSCFLYILCFITFKSCHFICFISITIVSIVVIVIIVPIIISVFPSGYKRLNLKCPTFSDDLNEHKHCTN